MLGRNRAGLADVQDLGDLHDDLDLGGMGPDVRMYL